MKKKVVFQLHAPGAKVVYLVGDFTEWEVGAKRMPRKRDEKDSFAVAVNLPHGVYEYKFIVDGEWWDDPKAERRGNDFGTTNSLVHVA
jgi:1,4-alpha-glucan branching enzyme